MGALVEEVESGRRDDRQGVGMVAQDGEQGVEVIGQQLRGDNQCGKDRALDTLRADPIPERDAGIQDGPQRGSVPTQGVMDDGVMNAVTLSSLCTATAWAMGSKSPTVTGRCSM